jgi:hypothetical protein
MAFEPIAGVNGVGGLPLGQFLQIAFTSGVFNQLNRTFPDFEMVKKFRVGDPNWREQRFLLQTSLGPSAIQYANPTFSGAFPKAQRIGISEKVAFSKEIDATVEIEYNLYKKALNSPLKYAEPLALEMQSKAIAAKRRIAADLYADGTGVIGTVSSVTAPVVSGGKITITLDVTNAARGHVGLFEYGDLVVCTSTSGLVLQQPTAAGIAALRVVSRSRKNNTVTCEAVDSDGNTVALPGITAVGDVSAGDLIYRAGQTDRPNLDLAVADYGTVSNVFAGFESLLANDGRTVHGIEMSGITAGTRVDCAGNDIALKYVQQGLSEAKVAVGQGLYKWDMLAMAPEARDFLVDLDEEKRRLTVSDSQRVKGAKAFIFQHENDTLEVISSEYISKKRAYALPKQAAGQSAMMQLYFTEMTPVDVGSGKLHLKPAAAGGHERRIASYMEGQIALLCTHPAAGVVLENFDIV